MRACCSRASSWVFWSPLTLAVALLSVSCIGLKQYRKVTVVPDGTSLRDEICEVSQPNKLTDTCAVEHRTYKFRDNAQSAKRMIGGKPEPHGDYYFASVEFDDRGWFWDRKQMETTLRLLYDLPEEEFLIFAYAHGWQHNASACDNNTVCFQRMLERLDFTLREAAVLESQESGVEYRKPRKVVGVYIGWRGRSGANKPARLSSFFNRKRAANRVGIGGVTELLTRLNDFRRYKNPRRDSHKTQLMIAGHSFGGQVIYKALSHSLIERAVAMEGDLDEGVDYHYKTANSFGDMVILVNPAFEGSAYEALQFAATNRCYPEKQRPSLMIVTSTADLATGLTFPIGRAVSNGFSPTVDRDQKKTVLHTVGHLPRYTSHVLELRNPPTEKEPMKSDRKKQSCDCPYLLPIDDRVRGRDLKFYTAKQEVLDLRQAEAGKAEDERLIHEMPLMDEYDLANDEDMSQFRQSAVTSLDDFAVSSYGESTQGGEMVLRRTGEYAANYPYLVVQTDKTFIPSHSAVYGERFTDFLRRFYVRHLAGDEQLNFPQQCFEDTASTCLSSDITPCERSWTGRSR